MAGGKFDCLIVRYNSRHEVGLIKIAIISPAIAIRAGLRALLGEAAQINITREAANLDEILAASAEVDVVVWAPASQLDQSALFDVFNSLKEDELPALLLVYNDPQVMEYLPQLPVRAWGLLEPESSQEELIAGIRALSKGLAVMNPAWLGQHLKRPARDETGEDILESLTTREMEVLQLLAYGLTNKQIAARLNISAHTVKFHISAIYNKLGTTNRVETVNLGLKKGLIVL